LKRAGAPAEVFFAFLGLGLSSFGGPVAHLAYFRRVFVDKRNWLTDADYAAIVSLCQFLPGPASSQTGFCIGMLRAGWPGALAAWVAFTLPSALLMFAAAVFESRYAAVPVAGRILHGMQLAAVAIVAQAVFVMAQRLCPDTPRRMLAVLAAAILLLVPDTTGQITVLLIGGFIGRFLPLEDLSGRPLRAVVPQTETMSLACLFAFTVLLLVSIGNWQVGTLALFAAFYRAGALVFGGGHVVLPLLQNALVQTGYVGPKLLLTAYGAAQALPGPLFTVAAFLGAVAGIGPGGAAGAAIALIAIFLPGLLLVAGLLPYWNRVRQNRPLSGCINGANAVVVGLLAYAWLNLVALGGIASLPDVAITALALLALVAAKAPPVLVVAGCIAAAII
jgi:chromate transporter